MVKWQEGLLYEMKAHMKYYFMADKNGKILWREEPIKEDAKRELEKIYYETHKKVYEKEHRQATGEEIAQAILDAGFVRIEDVEIDKKPLQEFLSGRGFDKMAVRIMVDAIWRARLIRVKERK